MADPFVSPAFLTQSLEQGTQAPSTRTVRSAEEAERIASEFEGFFLSQMLSSMFAGVSSADSQFGGGAGEKAFTGLLHEEYAKVFAASGGIGMTDRLKTEILRMQGLQSGSGTEVEQS